jgi:predicted aconitase with swiveling domain
VGSVAVVQGQPVVAGVAQGEALAADAPLSFWGGFDPETGIIIDRRHPLSGYLATRRVLVVPSGRGSCSGSGVLLEAIHNGTAPAAIITSRLDPVIGLGCVLGDELYDCHPPMVVISERDRQSIETGDLMEVNEQGLITVTKALSYGQRDRTVLGVSTQQRDAQECREREGVL